MGLSAKLFAVLLLLLIGYNTETQGPITMALARKCESPSLKFRGPCSRDANCASVCLTEGFTGGECKGLRHRCFCTRDC
ncbi:hypothetical protein BDA96_02G092900 [Sorghum bicolor]|uniref:Knottins-like domain-containing protein n=2 Tax=Sorghum bicolor TaxID=4558 RepID=A0A921RM65_SORBI|nr:defensin Ec-AMP-D1 [Sorghum bicolor]EER96126.1 hypothetical protein SORBI_3002G089600 [Sorghum bicolor]KAG0542314.1 hypothetical protein BDA96_02G092900 [Sorghum bicolor]|eukprot:XP_002459605.1 defensin Ec-AMP-D1 [Sorghum bicolor]